MIKPKKLLRFKEIKHGFTTKKEGDFSLGQDKATALFCQGNLILANQIHKDNIEVISKKDKGAIIAKTDGLLTKDNEIILGVRTADCVPLLFYEPEAKIAGALHAGWRGSLLGISGEIIRQICQIGGISKNIICVIGPHICEKCYDISKERQKLFNKKYIKNDCLDLTAINYDQLLQTGVKKENIEILNFCTFEDEKNFFSFRREGKNCGEILSFIGLI